MLTLRRRPKTKTDQLLLKLQKIVGPAAVLHRPEELIVYECDAYTLQKEIPAFVVLPRSTTEVSDIMRLCRDQNLPVVPRGAGTSLSGAVLPITGGVVISLSRMNKVLNVDAINRRALVEAGCVNAWISQATKEHGLFYAPDPSSQSSCTIGGNVATNSGGPHTLKHGVTTNHVLGLQMVLPDGEVTWLGVEPGGGEDLDGYDLRGAVIGSEGMFGVVTRVLVRLMAIPPAYKTFLVIFENVPDASRTVGEIISAGIVPGALEMMDQLIIQAVEAAYGFGFPLDAGAVLIIELEGRHASIEEEARVVEEICYRNKARAVRVAKTDQERADLWKSRKRAFGAIGRLSPNFLTQDGVVPRSRLPEIMVFIQECSSKYGLRIPNVFHAGDGNIHPLILYDERNPEEVRKAVAAGDEILEKCIALGGSASGEHGIGVEKVEFMSRQFSPEDLDAMMRMRKAFDPAGRMNPGKMFPGAKRCGDFQQVRKKQIAA